MRLNKTNQAKATDELLSILAQHPEGITTKELIGTPKFHGEKTLRSRQIIRLLRQSGKVAESYPGDCGYMPPIIWRLKKEK